MKELTPVQKSTLDSIKAYIRENGMAPAISEISSGMGWASPNNAHLKLIALEKKGYLTMKRGTNRGLVLTDSASVGTCIWSYADEPEYHWSGSCGIAWQFTEGCPVDNGFKYCPRCGKQIEIEKEMVSES